MFGSCLKSSILLFGALVVGGVPVTGGAETVRTEMEQTQSDDAPRQTLLEVWINGRPTGDTAFLMEKGARLYAAGSDLKQWRLRYGTAAALQYGAVEYIPLESLEGVTFRTDSKTMRLLISAEARAFSTSRFGLYDNGLLEPVVTTGGFFNYDVMLQGTRSESDASALGEVGIFGSAGLLVESFAYRDVPEGRDLIRLETTYRKDWPERTESLLVGDTVSHSGAVWGSAVRFGGVRWGSNFRTRPGLVTMPLLNLQGETALPSTVDLYINDALRMRQSVPPGPFAIDQIPLVSGSGEATLVVTDILGREQRISDRFYATPKLLRRRLAEYSLEAGYIRENFGSSSGDYGPFLASGTYRKGLNDLLTAELHAEYTSELQAAGLSGAWLYREAGVLSGALAFSRREGEAGVLGVAGFEHAGSAFSFGAQVTAASAAFARIGTASVPPRLEGHGYVGYTLPSRGAFSADYTYRDYRDRGNVAVVGIGYHHTWKDAGSLGISLRRVVVPDPDLSVALYWTRSFGEGRTGSLGFSDNTDSTRGSLRYGKNLPEGPGYGYSLAADFGTFERLEALYEWQTGYGTYGLGLSRTEGAETFRALARGGIAAMEGEWFLSRRIDRSFAVVDTGAYSGIDITKENLPIGRSGGDGKLLIPNLRAYEKNVIGIDPADLPMDASLPYLTYEAVPSYRSGVFVAFPLERVRRVLLRVIVEPGVPVPAGATARIAGTAAAFPVGRDGRLFLEGVKEHNHIELSWNGTSCAFYLEYPRGDEPMPDLGTFVCKGVPE